MPDITQTIDIVLDELATCRICARKLNQIAARRAWWFRPVREVFASGIRAFALFHKVPDEAYALRAPMCGGCLRLRKNKVRQGSAVFRWLDARLNPVFNAIRDRLLTPQELEHARELAYRAGDPGFQGW